jgi:hypothetical protein
MSHPEKPNDTDDDHELATPAPREAAHDVSADAADADEGDDASDAAVRSLLKRALGPGTVSGPPPDLLPGVQRRIRVRSRGKFYADGWSTGQARVSYALAGLVTVALALVAYLAMVPTATH